MTRTKAKGIAKKSSSNSPIKQVRKVHSSARIQLFVKAGGRCQFCNNDVMSHHLTQMPGTFGDIAHIVAFKEKGPRGNDLNRPKDINAITNLMLLCLDCHKLIDDFPLNYPRSTLEAIKEEHETRIKTSTEICPEKRSAVLIFTSPIRGQEVSIRNDHIRQAMYPYYPVSSKCTQIDLTSLKGQKETPNFLSLAKTQIKRAVDSLFDVGGEAEKCMHLSVFGIGPMIQLMILGSTLSNKVPACFYQRHRDTEDWTWKNEGQPAKYKLSKIQTGDVKDLVALILSLSGTIPIANLPTLYKENASIYEIKLDEQIPNPMFLRQYADLEAFRSIYIETLRVIADAHGLQKTISVFPAVPAPIAILCGRERLPKVDPKLRVYDFDHTNKGFKFQGIIGD
ncbi:HNH endonuclease [Estrella lausannensis]|uniref:SMODS-associated and fused to various effectors domain-containing protein n=1 Tax=Estrella lausannensis TaxID=483423 RepID=A0A0H5DP90_9BACT|nr:HNH endonuclease [Estrella lausannensis]CRX38202.1 hypothetical protein ELAC_0853 [Estrella lausannensis]